MLQYIIALVGILIFGYFIYNKPTVETYVLFVAYGLCLIDTKILPMEYGLVRLFDVVTITALFLFFKEFISFRTDGKGQIYLILVLMFWFLIVIGKANSQFPLNNYQFLYQPFTIFIYARFLILYLMEKKENIFKFISVFQFSVMVMVGVVFIQVLFGTEFTYYPGVSTNVFNEETGITRYPGLLNDSQACGQFLALGSFSLLMFKRNISIRRKRLQYACFFLAVIAILLAGSRSALGGWLLGMLVVFFVQNAKIKTLMLSFSLIAFSALLFISPKGGGVFSRTDTLSSDLSFRQSIWEETGGIIEQYPMLGIGFANFQKYITKYHQDLFLEAGGELSYFTQPENGFLKILVEHGYIGFFIFVLLILLPLLKCLKLMINGEEAKEMIYPIVAILSWTVAFNTVYSFIDYRILLLVVTYVSICIHSSEYGSNLGLANTY